MSLNGIVRESNFCIQFRSAAHHHEVQRIYENMTIIHFLPNPLLIIDPLNISIEYLFRASQTGIIYTGDPDFEDDVKEFSRKFDSIIIRHFAFDADVYKRTYERAMRQVRSAHVIDITRASESLTCLYRSWIP